MRLSAIALAALVIAATALPLTAQVRIGGARTTTSPGGRTTPSRVTPSRPTPSPQVAPSRPTRTSPRSFPTRRSGGIRTGSGSRVRPAPTRRTPTPRTTPSRSSRFRTTPSQPSIRRTPTPRTAPTPRTTPRPRTGGTRSGFRTTSPSPRPRSSSSPNASSRYRTRPTTTPRSSSPGIRIGRDGEGWNRGTSSSRSAAERREGRVDRVPSRRDPFPTRSGSGSGFRSGTGTSSRPATSRSLRFENRFGRDAGESKPSAVAGAKGEEPGIAPAPVVRHPNAAPPSLGGSRSGAPTATLGGGKEGGAASGVRTGGARTGVEAARPNGELLPLGTGAAGAQRGRSVGHSTYGLRTRSSGDAGAYGGTVPYGFGYGYGHKGGHHHNHHHGWSWYSAYGYHYSPWFGPWTVPYGYHHGYVGNAFVVSGRHWRFSFGFGHGHYGYHRAGWSFPIYRRYHYYPWHYYNTVCWYPSYTTVYHRTTVVEHVDSYDPYVDFVDDVPVKVETVVERVPAIPEVFQRPLTEAFPETFSGSELLAKGQGFMREGESLLAAEAFRRAWMAAPSDYFAPLELGLALFATGGHFGLAGYALEEGLDRNPAWVGRDLDLPGRFPAPEAFEAAFVDLKRHLLENPLDAEARFLFAYLQYFQGEWFAAHTEFSRLLEGGYESDHLEAFMAAAEERLRDGR